MKLRTQSQELAEYAVDCVRKDVLNRGSEVRKRYKSYISSFPALLVSEGLMLALAFNLSKATPSKDKETTHENVARFLVFKHVVNWLKRKEILDLEIYDIKELSEKGGDVIKRLSEDMDIYRLASNEALKVSDWLKRIAEGLIEEEEGGE